MKSLRSSFSRAWSRLPRWLRFSIIGSSSAVLLASAAGGLVWHHYASEAAKMDISMLTRGQDETLLLDAHGEVVGSAGEVERELVSLDEVSPLLVKAVIATEDARFYSHHGFDTVGLTRAAVKNFTAGGIRQGGSTITQQLARNAFGLQERNYQRKIKEIFLAMRIENTWPKDKILTHYLNRIYLGHGFYGVGAAARGYFGKEVSELNLNEAATLAAIIKAPVSFSPITHPEIARQKRDLTLKRMADTGMITQAEANNVLQTPVVVNPDKTRVRTGYTLAAARSEFERRGFKTGVQPETTISLRLDWQRKLDDMTRRHLDQLANSPSHKLQSAIVVLDNETGAILAMQGGRDFVFSPFNRALDGRRPAGTAFLPIVYATAFTVSANSSSTKLLDGPLDNRQAMIGGRSGTLGEWGAEGGGVTYAGTLLPQQALLEGRTAATVRLGYATGLDKIHDWLQRSIFTSTLRSEAAFLLGQSAVSPVEMARAYTAIASDGRLCPQAHLLAGDNGKSTPVFTPGAARQVREIMLASMMRPEYRAALAKHGLAGRGIAGFGGVAYGSTDAWFAGFDRKVTCVVWVGHDKDAPIMTNATSAVAALPLWAEAFSMVTEGSGKSWGRSELADRVTTVIPRAQIVTDEVVPAVQPESSVVIGHDCYRTGSAASIQVAGATKK